MAKARSSSKSSKTDRSNRTYKTRGFSIDPQLEESAMNRARELNMSWSEYVRRCLEADIRVGGPMQIKPGSRK